MPGSDVRGDSAARISAGSASPQWAPPPAPSVWPGDAPPPARHAVCLQAVAYLSDSASQSDGVDSRRRRGVWER